MASAVAVIVQLQDVMVTSAGCRLAGMVDESHEMAEVTR